MSSDIAGKRAPPGDGVDTAAVGCAAGTLETERHRADPRKHDVSNDAKMIVVVGAIVSSIFGSAWIVSNVMIRLTEVVRTDLRDLRDSLERAACGELARQGNVAVESVSATADTLGR